MRKFLLLFSLLLTVGIASATTAKVTFSESGYANQEKVTSFTVGDVTVSLSKGTGSSDPAYFTSGAMMRVYTNNAITFTAPEGQVVTNVSFTTVSDNYAINSDCKVSSGSFSGDVWSGSTNELTITNTGKQQVRFTAVEVTYGEGSTTVEPTPSESNAVCFYAQGYSYTGSASPAVEVSGTLTGATAAHGTTFTAPNVCSIDWYRNNNTQTNVNSGLIRWYQNDQLYVYPEAGVTINKITIKCGSGYTGKTLTAPLGVITEDKSALTYTWTGSATTSFDIQVGAQIRVQYIEIEYTVDSSVEVIAAPKIELGDNNTVTLSQADGLEIRYTLDETEPTATSTLYTGPFTISGVTTVKAVAVKDGKLSSVNTVKLYPNNLASLGDFLTIQPASNAKINAPLTAIYQCGRNLYLTDGTDYILAYNGNNVEAVSNLGAQNGDVLSYVSGTYKSQNGLPEVIVSEIGEKTAGTAVMPNELAIEEIGSDMLNHYVKITDVNITAASSTNNYTANDGTGEIIIYNTFSNATNYPGAITQVDGTKSNAVPEGEGFTVYGFISIYNSTMQLTPIRFEGGKVMEPAATPVFTPASGSELSIGDQITIECETEGATIYVAFDGEEPTTESMVYSAPLTYSEACTIKAIAVKEGMLNSEVATASYTTYIPGSAKAVFDFSDSEKTLGQVVSGSLEFPEGGKGSNLSNDVVLQEGPVMVSFDKADNTSNNIVWHNYVKADVSYLECRVYKQNQYTVSLAEDGYKITKITFEQHSVSTTWGEQSIATNLSEAETSDAMTFVAPEGLCNFVSFTPQANVRFAKMTVEYVQDENGVQGIEEINSDNNNAPVEFYNLQGIRVAADNLTPGIYVCRQGTQVTKVLVK